MGARTSRGDSYAGIRGTGARCLNAFTLKDKIIYTSVGQAREPGGMDLHSAFEFASMLNEALFVVLRIKMLREPLSITLA